MLACCSRNKVNLPNNYLLFKDKDEKTYIYDSFRNKKIKNPVSQFSVDDSYIVGWIDVTDLAFFSLNTENGELRIFKTHNELNRHLFKLNKKPLKMSNSYTYLDIVTGLKKPTW